MVRHVVLMQLRNEVGPAEIAALYAQLAALRSVLPGMLAFSGGANVSPEGLGRGFSHGFTCDFEDAPARDAYLEHPAHKAAGARLVAATRGGVEGLLVLDFEFP